MCEDESVSHLHYTSQTTEFDVVVNGLMNDPSNDGGIPGLDAIYKYV
jgi:hypothetical protein